MNKKKYNNITKNDQLDNKYKFGEEIIMEEIQDGPQEAPIFIPMEFVDENKNA